MEITIKVLERNLYQILDQYGIKEENMSLEENVQNIYFGLFF
jgi:hypothetical protein